MPRIEAASLAEHVAQQEERVFTAAIRLFIERGYDQVTLGDIAAKIGLARNSLYRYFPDKAHILVRWLRQELPLQAARSAQTLSGDGDAVTRIERWALDQLDYAASPEHALVARVSELSLDLDPQTRADLAASHETAIRPLLDTLAAAGVRSGGDRLLIAGMIQQLVLATARARPSPDDAAAWEAGRRYLLAGIRGLVKEASGGAGSPPGK